MVPGITTDCGAQIPCIPTGLGPVTSIILELPVNTTFCAQHRLTSHPYPFYNYATRTNKCIVFNDDRSCLDWLEHTANPTPPLKWTFYLFAHSYRPWPTCPPSYPRHISTYVYIRWHQDRALADIRAITRHSERYDTNAPRRMVVFQWDLIVKFKRTTEIVSMPEWENTESPPS